jgi:hypothetical protein
MAKVNEGISGNFKVFLSNQAERINSIKDTRIKEL